MPSKSFENLSTRLQDVRQLLKAHKRVTGDKPGRRRDVEALNRAGVVLLSANLEGFVEDLFTEAVSTIHASQLAMDKVPERLRAAQLEEEVMRPISQGDRRSANQRICTIALKTSDLWNPSVQANATNLNASKIIGQMSNPGTNEIDGLFWYLGLERVMDAIKWKKAPNINVKRVINELVGKRNAIAHGTPGVGVGKGDVMRYVKYVRGVAKRLEARVSAQLTTILGKAPWPT